MVLKSESLLALTNLLLSTSEISYLSIGIGMRLADSGVQLAVGKQTFIFFVLSKPHLRPTQPRVIGNWGRFLQGEKRPGKHSVFSYPSKYKTHNSIALYFFVLQRLTTNGEKFTFFFTLPKKAFVVELFYSLAGLRKVKKLKNVKPSGQESNLWYIVRADKQCVQVKL